MQQFGGKDSKRHFTVVMGGKEHGLYVSSTPSSAAKKAVTKLCAANKSKKVEFHIREITQGSKKKTYGPYEGHIEKLKEPIELKGRVVKYKPAAKLQKKNSKMKGGLFGRVTESNTSNEGKQKMFENFKVENQQNPAPYHYKKRFNNPSTLYFGNLLDINGEKYYPYSFIIIDGKHTFRILTSNLNSELNTGLSIFKDYLTKLEINNYYILVINDLTAFIDFIVKFYDKKSNLYKYTISGFKTDNYSLHEEYKKQINIYIIFYDMIKKIIESFSNSFGITRSIGNKQYEEILKDFKDLPSYINILSEKLKYMKKFSHFSKIMNSSKDLDKLKQIFNSYTKNNHDKLKCISEIKRKFESQLKPIFLEKLKEKYELNNNNIQKLNFWIPNKTYEFICNQRLNNPNLNDEQLFENFKNSAVENSLEIFEESIKKIKLERKKKEEENKFIETLRNINDLYIYKGQQRWFYEKGINTEPNKGISWEQMLKSYYTYINPYECNAYRFIRDEFLKRKYYEPESDDKELIKKIVREFSYEIKEKLEEENDKLKSRANYHFQKSKNERERTREQTPEEKEWISKWEASH